MRLLNYASSPYETGKIFVTIFPWVRRVSNVTVIIFAKQSLAKIIRSLVASPERSVVISLT
jgi:hypothetical protein